MVATCPTRDSLGVDASEYRMRVTLKESVPLGLSLGLEDESKTLSCLAAFPETLP